MSLGDIVFGLFVAYINITDPLEGTMIDRNQLGSATMIEPAQFINGEIDYSNCGTVIQRIHRVTLDYEAVSWKAISLNRSAQADSAYIQYLKDILGVYNG